MAETDFLTNKLSHLEGNLSGLSGTAYKMLSSLTASTIWGETDLQYHFTSDEGFDTGGDIGFYFSVSTLDDSFGFSSLAIRAYQMIDSVSNLDFTKSDTSTDADHILGSVTDSNTNIEGFFEFPNTGNSFGVLNQGLSQMAADPELAGDGEYANWTVLHEIGHGLGLKHTHKETNGLPPLDTVGAAMDNERYSVMSYNGSATASAYGHAVSLMALDVATLQALYGKEAYATGASTYTLNDAGDAALDLTEGDVEIGRAYYCIWDSGGVDELNYGGTASSVLLNLNDATLETGSIAGSLKSLIAALKTTDYFAELSEALKLEITDSWHHAGGFFSRVLDDNGGSFVGIDGGFSIANGAQIENAIGGALDDLIIGNEGVNTLSGLGGGDTMLGGAGVDTVDGGSGGDWLDGGKGADTLTGGLDGDRFVFAKGYGRDAITDFVDGDLIDLSRLAAIKSFRDLTKNHMEQDGNDVRVVAGKDVLVIEGVDTTELGKFDFVI
jgi:Ca2+-binding RTX toxin-like protein